MECEHTQSRLATRIESLLTSAGASALHTTAFTCSAWPITAMGGEGASRHMDENCRCSKCSCRHTASTRHTLYVHVY